MNAFGSWMNCSVSRGRPIQVIQVSRATVVDQWHGTRRSLTGSGRNATRSGCARAQEGRRRVMGRVAFAVVTAEGGLQLRRCRNISGILHFLFAYSDGSRNSHQPIPFSLFAFHLSPLCAMTPRARPVKQLPWPTFPGRCGDGQMRNSGGGAGGPRCDGEVDGRIRLSQPRVEFGMQTERFGVQHEQCAGEAPTGKREKW